METEMALVAPRAALLLQAHAGRRPVVPQRVPGDALLCASVPRAVALAATLEV